MKTLLTLLLFYISISVSMACDCEGEESTVEYMFHQSSNIFTGTVISIENATQYKQYDGQKFYYQAVTIETTEHFKGDTTNQIIVINEGFSNCGTDFQIGESYLFYPFTSSKFNKFMVHQCHKPTRLLVYVEQEVKKLRELKSSR